MVRKELGKWIMDIAKYLATVVLISALFRDMQETSTIVIFGVPSFLLILIAGLLLIKEPKNKVQNKKNKNKNK